MEITESAAIYSLAQATHTLTRFKAMGVETETQMARLQELGCDEVQGYLLGRPLAADEYVAMIPRGGALACVNE